METPDQEAMGSHNSSTNIQTSECGQVFMKGKRTKRQRLLLPPAPVAMPASSTSSVEFSGSTTEEEEDMANCLILLAQGRSFDCAGPRPDAAGEELIAGRTEKFMSRRFAEATTTTNGKAGFYVYECKTCNKCFPSFQALGGHRASHKKPKIAIPVGNYEKKEMSVDEDRIQISLNSFSKPITVAPNNNKPRVHECSICGSEFTSGQALGGHMRRHRPASLPETHQELQAKKERNVLSLDLNLPAPSDDTTAFQFTSKQPLIFSASALVDCLTKQLMEAN